MNNPKRKKLFIIIDHIILLHIIIIHIITAILITPIITGGEKWTKKIDKWIKIYKDNNKWWSMNKNNNLKYKMKSPIKNAKIEEKVLIKKVEKIHWKIKLNSYSIDWNNYFELKSIIK